MYTLLLSTAALVAPLVSAAATNITRPYIAGKPKGPGQFIFEAKSTPHKFINPDGTANWTEINAKQNFIHKRYSKDWAHKRGGSENIATTQNGAYLINFEIGTPGQNMQCLLDSGSNIVWVPGAGCSESNGHPCGGYANGQSGNIYNPAASSSSANTGGTINQCYDAGCMLQEVYTETVFVGNYGLAGFEIGVTTDELPGDGAGNFGWGYTLAWNTWNYAAWQTGLISAGIMGWYGPSNLYHNGVSGEMAIGALNTARYTGSIHYAAQNPSSSYWQISMDSVIINGQTVASNVQTIFDTGTWGIGAPTAALPALHAAIPGASQINGSPTSWQYPCNQGLSVSWGLGGAMWPMQIWSYGQVSSGSSMCVSIFSSTGSDEWLLGVPAMADFYTVFDMQNARMGFATLAAGL